MKLLSQFILAATLFCAAEVSAATVHRSIEINTSAGISGSPFTPTLERLSLRGRFQEGVASVMNGDTLLVDFEIQDNLAIRFEDLGGLIEGLRADPSGLITPGFTLTRLGVEFTGFSGNLVEQFPFNAMGSSAFDFLSGQVAGNLTDTSVDVWAGRLTFEFVSGLPSGTFLSSVVLMPFADEMSIVERTATVPLPAGLPLLASALALLIGAALRVRGELPRRNATTRAGGPLRAFPGML